MEKKIYEVTIQNEDVYLSILVHAFSQDEAEVSTYARYLRRYKQSTVSAREITEPSELAELRRKHIPEREV